jgi:hypothetical protein
MKDKSTKTKKTLTLNQKRAFLIVYFIMVIFITFNSRSRSIVFDLEYSVRKIDIFGTRISLPCTFGEMGGEMGGEFKLGGNPVYFNETITTYILYHNETKIGSIGLETDPKGTNATNLDSNIHKNENVKYLHLDATQTEIPKNSLSIDGMGIGDSLADVPEFLGKPTTETEYAVSYEDKPETSVSFYADENGIINSIIISIIGGF